jgi:hypothetical protein
LLPERVFGESLARNVFPLCSLLLEHVFAEPLAGSEFPLWLRYSGFQASCHIITIIIIIIIIIIIYVYVSLVVSSLQTFKLKC